MSRLTRRVGSALAAVVVLALSACGGGGGDSGGGGGAPKRITVWTGDTLPDRVAATQAIVDKFTAATGIKVELVGVDEDQFNQTLTSAAAAGELPDVIGSLPLASVRTLAANELVDTAATAEVVEALGADTFDQRALELTRDGDAQLAVPSDAWAQLLYYRKDLFDTAGLPAPNTYDDILNAAAHAGHRRVWPASPGPPRPVTPSPSRPSSTSRWPTAARWSTTGRQDHDRQPAVRRRVHLLPRPDHELLGARRAGRRHASGRPTSPARPPWSSGRRSCSTSWPACATTRCPAAPSARADPRVPGQEHRDRHRPAGPGRHQPAQFGEVSSWAITGRRRRPTRPSSSSSTC